MFRRVRLLGGGILSREGVVVVGSTIAGNTVSDGLLLAVHFLFVLIKFASCLISRRTYPLAPYDFISDCFRRYRC